MKWQFCWTRNITLLLYAWKVTQTHCQQHTWHSILSFRSPTQCIQRKKKCLARNTLQSYNSFSLPWAKRQPSIMVFVLAKMELHLIKKPQLCWFLWTFLPNQRLVDMWNNTCNEKNHISKWFYTHISWFLHAFKTEQNNLDQAPVSFEYTSSNLTMRSTDWKYGLVEIMVT